MATKSSFWLRGKKGRLAGTTVYQSKGRTIQREIVDVSNPQTRAQMEQRIKWANLVNAYKVLKPIMKFAFETKKGAQSDYNKFMSLNAVRTWFSWLTKQQATMSYVCPDAFMISCGSLNSVTDSQPISGNKIASLISVGTLQSLTATTKISDFSSALLAANSFLSEGMQISFVAMNVGEIDVMKTPSLTKYEVILNTNNTDTLAAYLPIDKFGIVEVDSVNVLAFTPKDTEAICGAFILSLTSNGITRVSTEDMAYNTVAATLRETMQETYTLDKAIESYGVQDNAFLNSKEAKEA